MCVCLVGVCLCNSVVFVYVIKCNVWLLCVCVVYGIILDVVFLMFFETVFFSVACPMCMHTFANAVRNFTMWIVVHHVRCVVRPCRYRLFLCKICIVYVVGAALYKLCMVLAMMMRCLT